MKDLSKVKLFDLVKDVYDGYVGLVLPLPNGKLGISYGRGDWDELEPTLEYRRLENVPMHILNNYQWEKLFEEATDIFNKPLFKKSDLKQGMVVEIEDGNKYFVFENVNTKSYGLQKIFLKNMSQDGFMTGGSYSDDLICYDSAFNVVRVYAATFGGEDYGTEHGELIWEK